MKQEAFWTEARLADGVIDTEVESMKVTLATSTGAKIDIWRERELFCAQRTDQFGEPQTCWGVDLFEVIAELAQLDLDDRSQAAEAIQLASRAHRRLRGV
jgi:hypothetical protein